MVPFFVSWGFVVHIPCELCILKWIDAIFIRWIFFLYIFSDFPVILKTCPNMLHCEVGWYHFHFFDSWSSDFPVVLKTIPIIVKMTSDKNSSRKDCLTLLHLAAGKEHFQVSTFVMENFENKNPGSYPISSGPIRFHSGPNLQISR